jgi:hypothetical protein
MLRECFGRFGGGECVGCSLFEMCSGYYVVSEVGRCPLFGIGFNQKNEMCRLCLKYFVGEDCRSSSRKRQCKV